MQIWLGCHLKNIPCLCRFKKAAKKIPGKFGQRYWKNVGLGFKTPKEAIEGKEYLLPLHGAQQLIYQSSG